MTTCPWYTRWYHARLRHADQAFMVPAILDAAANTPDAVERRSRTARAFDRFIHQRGQEHWLCPCATADRLAVQEGFHAPH